MTVKEWQEKYKIALDIKEQKNKYFLDQLLLIRRQLRNYIAHGAFGKQGKTFSFHSNAGAVPVILPHQVKKNRFTINEEYLSFDEETTIKVIEDFINHIWSGSLKPAKIYIQESLLQNRGSLIVNNSNYHGLYPFSPKKHQK